MSEEGYRLISPRGRPKIYTQTLRQLIDSASYDGKPSIVLTTKRISAEITNLGESLYRFMALLIRTKEDLYSSWHFPRSASFSILFNSTATMRRHSFLNSTATIRRHSLQFDCHAATAFPYFDCHSTTAFPSIRLPLYDGIPSFNSTATMQRHSL
jgi:hypothetical protein